MVETETIDEDGQLNYPLCVLRPKLCENFSLGSLKVTHHIPYTLSLQGSVKGKATVYLYGYYQEYAEDEGDEEGDDDFDMSEVSFRDLA